MRKNVIILMGVIVLMLAISAMATKPLDDYSFIRGVCHPGGWRADEATIRKELGYAQRMQLNSSRFWLSPRWYERDPEGFINQIRTYVRIAHSLGISSMPILFI